MKIEIEQYSDGFSIIVNGDVYNFNQEDTVEGLIDVFNHVIPDAKISFNDVY